MTEKERKLFDLKVKFAKEDDMINEIALGYFQKNTDVLQDMFIEMLEFYDGTKEVLDSFLELNKEEWKEFLEKEGYENEN